MGPNTATPLRRITDGTSKTFMVGEIRTGTTSQDARGVWALGQAGASLLAAYGSALMTTALTRAIRTPTMFTAIFVVQQAS